MQSVPSQGIISINKMAFNFANKSKSDMIKERKDVCSSTGWFLFDVPGYSMICQSKNLETLMPLDFLFKKKSQDSFNNVERESRLQNDNSDFPPKLPWSSIALEIQ